MYCRAQAPESKFYTPPSSHLGGYTVTYTTVKKRSFQAYAQLFGATKCFQEYIIQISIFQSMFKTQVVRKFSSLYKIQWKVIQEFLEIGVNDFQAEVKQ